MRTRLAAADAADAVEAGAAAAALAAPLRGRPGGTLPRPPDAPANCQQSILVASTMPWTGVVQAQIHLGEQREVRAEGELWQQTPARQWKPLGQRPRTQKPRLWAPLGQRAAGTAG